MGSRPIGREFPLAAGSPASYRTGECTHSRRQGRWDRASSPAGTRHRPGSGSPEVTRHCGTADVATTCTLALGNRELEAVYGQRRRPWSPAPPAPWRAGRAWMKSASVARDASASRLRSSPATSTPYRCLTSRSSSVPVSESSPTPAPNSGVSAGVSRSSGRRVTAARIWRSSSRIRARLRSAPGRLARGRGRGRGRGPGQPAWKVRQWRSQRPAEDDPLPCRWLAAPAGLARRPGGPACRWRPGPGKTRLVLACPVSRSPEAGRGQRQPQRHVPVIEH